MPNAGARGKEWPRFTSVFLDRIVHELWKSRKGIVNISAIECIADKDARGEWLEIRLTTAFQVLVLLTISDCQIANLKLLVSTRPQRTLFIRNGMTITGNPANAVKCINGILRLLKENENASDYQHQLTDILSVAIIRIA